MYSFLIPSFLSSRPVHRGGLRGAEGHVLLQYQFLKYFNNFYLFFSLILCAADNVTHGPKAFTRPGDGTWQPATFDLQVMYVRHEQEKKGSE